MLWVILVLIYGLIKGMREVLKKKALERNSTLEVLLMYTILSFLIVTPEIRNAGGVEPKVMLFVAIKSLAIFYAWRCGFEALSKLPVSLFSVLDLARVAFSMLLGVLVLHESMGINQIIGLVLVVAGLLLLQKHKSDGASDGPGVRSPRFFFIVLALISSLLNAVSALFDKLLMTHTAITDGQLQFWYMFFLVIYYLLFAFLKRRSLRIDFRSAIKNYWIWILAVLFVIADRCLFIANSDPASKVTVMTLIKQSGVIFSIICGRLLFKEKNTGFRMLCAMIILAGIFISVF